MSTKLSVNLNKFATLRNSRGGKNPDLVRAAIDAQSFGADGITLHPRPDERHIRYADVFDIKNVIYTELNIEGNCREQKFIDLVLKIKPQQVTLVPDEINQLTSNHGWDTIKNKTYLKEIIPVFQNAGIRTSIFVNPDIEMIKGAADLGTNRIELYTEAYAANFMNGPENAILTYKIAAEKANECGLEINAGHDLDLFNLQFFSQTIPQVKEVSIGHALVCDALYYGFQNTIQMYKRLLH